MSQHFKKILLSYRNLYPFLFYKCNALEIGYLDHQRDLSYNYIYNPEKLSIYINNDLKNLFEDDGIYNLVYFTIYNEFSNEPEIINIINHIFEKKLNEKSLFIIFLNNVYKIDFCEIIKKYENDKIPTKSTIVDVENFKLFIFSNNL